MPTSAGILMYRFVDKLKPATVEVLLVHPGGPFFAKKDAGAWTIPKGEPDPGEELLECAKREFREETGFDSGPGPYLSLGDVKQKGGKTVHAWAVEGVCDPTQLKSNSFKLQWPPRSGRWIDVPEIDRGRLVLALRSGESDKRRPSATFKASRRPTEWRGTHRRLKGSQQKTPPDKAGGAGGKSDSSSSCFG